MNKKCSCNPFCKQTYKSTICPTIIKSGPMGIRGPTGPTGPTGPSGETIEVRSTTTLEPNQNARVTSTHIGNSTFLEFFIPRGYDGKSDSITIGNIEEVSATTLADVADRYENGVHYLDFKIPQGPTGPKGDTGPRGLPGEIGISEVITIDGTETIDSDQPAEVQDDFDRNIHHLTFYIPKGETGPQGEQGIAGPPGLTPDYNGTIYNPNEQTISNNMSLVMNQVELNNGLQIEDSSLRVPTTGTYLISFSINNCKSAMAGDCVGIAINNVIKEASKRPLTVSTNVSATIATLLNRDDVVTLVANVSTDRTITASGAPSAMLTLMMISY